MKIVHTQFKKVIMIFCIAMLFATNSIRANDASMGRYGETVYPLTENDVVMVSEDIYINYVRRVESEYDATVSCEFVFENTGEEKTVLMGFPATLENDNPELTDENNIRLHNFTAYLNGDEIEVTEVDGNTLNEQFSKYPTWYVFEVPFKADEILTMTHTYDMNLFNDSGGHHLIGYVLETGSTWKENIGHSKVTFNMSVMNAYGIESLFSYQPGLLPFSLRDLRYDGTNICFEKYDFIPDFNLEIYFSYKGFKDFWGIDEYRTEEQWESVNFFESATEVERDRIIELYNGLSYTDRLLEFLYIRNLADESSEEAPVVTGFSIEDNQQLSASISDSNFDMEYEGNVTYHDIYGESLGTRNLVFGGEFGDYPNLVYYKNDDYYVPGDTAVFEIEIADSMGNKSITLFDKEGNTVGLTVNNQVLQGYAYRVELDESPVPTDTHLTEPPESTEPLETLQPSVEPQESVEPTESIQPTTVPQESVEPEISNNQEADDRTLNKYNGALPIVLGVSGAVIIIAAVVLILLHKKKSNRSV